jgi:hypothetical protein
MHIRAQSVTREDPMPTDHAKRKALWGRWIEALVARDLSRAGEVAEEMCGPQYVLHNPGLPDLGRGPAAAKAFAGHVIATYTDIRLTLEDFFGEGDRTAVRSTVRVTVIATGQRVTYPVLNIMRWDGDALAERWELAGPHEEQA